MKTSMNRLALLLIVPSALATLGVGCARERGEDLLVLLDVLPQNVELGDRVQVLGRGFPVGGKATVTFRGTRHMPGKDPEERWTASVEATAISEETVEFVLTEGVLSRLGNDHVTFEGDIGVAFPAGEDRVVRGTLRDVTVDFHPPTAGRLATRLGREGKARAALAFMGIVPATTPPETGGIAVERVKEGGRAARAGVRPGDVLVGFRGQPVLGLADLVPAPGLDTAELELQRAGSRGPVTVELSFRGYSAGVPPDLVTAGLLLLAALIAILIFMAPTAGIITWVERRVWGRMQSRVGPNRVGPQGFLQWLADGIKAITKEDIIPRETDKGLFRMAPYLVFLGVSVTFVVMPFGQYVIAADLDIGILYVVAATAYVTIGLMMGGWASNNKWSLLGGIRSAAQIVSYEIPAALAIASVAMMTGTLRLQGIVHAQGGLPHKWIVFANPATFVLFFLYFTAALAEANRTPFDLPEAESELVAGYSTEYSGMRYLFFFFAEWANVFVMSGLSTALFLGGWQLPFVSPMQQEASTALQILGVASFLLKSWILVFVVIWIRATLPRIRIDQLMNMCWKVLVPASFILFAATGGWVLWRPSALIKTVTSLAMVAVGLAIIIQFARRVLYNYRSSNRGMQAFRLNPFV